MLIERKINPVKSRLRRDRSAVFNRVKINDKDFEFALKLRKGVRYVKLAIYQDGYFVVTAPRFYPLYVIEKFLVERSGWIADKLKKVDLEAFKTRRKEYLLKKNEARAIIQARLDFFNAFYGFNYRKISIRNQRTCWGSCSQRNNLSFNYRAAYLPEKLRDYVIVHELCHLSELNHSRQFWQLVARAIPNYKKLRRELRAVNKI